MWRIMSLVVLGIPTMAWAKDPCSGLGVQADAFDEATQVVPGRGLSVSLTKSEITSSWTLGENGASNVDIAPGFKLLLLLEDGSKLELVSQKAAKPSSNVYASQYSASVSTSWMLTFPLDSATLSTLAATRIQVMRYSISKETTWNVPSSSAKYYQKRLACAASLLSD